MRGFTYETANVKGKIEGKFSKSRPESAKLGLGFIVFSLYTDPSPNTIASPKVLNLIHTINLQAGEWIGLKLNTNPNPNRILGLGTVTLFLNLLILLTYCQLR